MAKIQEPDNSVMNRLYASAQGKQAAKKDDNVSEVAFKDHEEFLNTLEGVLSSDNKTSWDPNDPVLD